MSVSPGLRIVVCPVPMTKLCAILPVFLTTNLTSPCFTGFCTKTVLNLFTRLPFTRDEVRDALLDAREQDLELLLGDANRSDRLRRRRRLRLSRRRGDRRSVGRDHLGRRLDLTGDGELSEHSKARVLADRAGEVVRLPPFSVTVSVADWPGFRVGVFWPAIWKSCSIVPLFFTWKLTTPAGAEVTLAPLESVKTKSYSIAETLMSVTATFWAVFGPTTPANEKPATAVPATAKQTTTARTKRRMCKDPLVAGRQRVGDIQNRSQSTSVQTARGRPWGRPRKFLRVAYFSVTATPRRRGCRRG